MISRTVRLALFLIIAVTGRSEAMDAIQKARLATVKISKTFTHANYCTPWKMQSYSTAVGSGVIIPGGLILTNAHIVSDATYIEVQKENDPDMYEAVVLFAGHECDLALLRVKDKNFFIDTESLEFGPVPSLKSVVAAVGYPMGGSRISITEGVVSRIEMGVYSHSSKLSLLLIQIDAAINPGNSGGPVIQGDKISGIAFQMMSDSNNIGYIIPTPVIYHFLRDVSDGKYDGFPYLNVSTDPLINESYREYFRLAKHQTGVIVTGLIKGDESGGRLKMDDVILSVEGADISNDGTIPFGESRLPFSQKIQEKQWGESVSMEILRNREVRNISIPLKEPRIRIPWYNEYETPPSYFIYGGIVFQPLSREYLKCWNDWWENADLTMLYYFSYLDADSIDPDRKEFILINHVLPDSANTYISNMHDLLVSRINGRKINEMEDVISAFKNPVRGYHIIDVEGNSKPLVIKAKDLKDVTKRILEKYQVPADRRLSK